MQEKEATTKNIIKASLSLSPLSLSSASPTNHQSSFFPFFKNLASSKLHHITTNNNKLFLFFSFWEKLLLLHHQQ
jgi:hypothetical protein